MSRIDFTQDLLMKNWQPSWEQKTRQRSLEEDKIFPSEKFQRFVLNDIESPHVKERFYPTFMDEKLAAFMGTTDQAKEVVFWLNTLWPGLDFTYEWSDKAIKFLNVKTLITPGGLETNLYVKPTNPQLYLHFTL